MDGSKIGRVMLTYRSSDFNNWSRAKATAFARPGQLTAKPISGQQTHMGAGIWNRGNALVGLYGMWQDAPEKPKDSAYWNEGVTIDLGLIVSNDGIHFREPVPGHKVISRGTKEEWDNTALLQGHAFANVGDKTMMWYSHWDTGGKLRNMEIGLATLRRDGFGYLSRKVENSAAGFETTSFDVKGNAQLFVNVEGISSAAPLKVELLDSRAKPLAGFSGADAAQLSKPGTRQKVVWPGKVSRLPQDKKLSIKVSYPKMNGARVYAIYVGKN